MFMTALIIFCYLITMCICGGLCVSISKAKGYKRSSVKAFFIGFFLDILGLIYYVALPLARDNAEYIDDEDDDDDDDDDDDE